MKGRRDAAVAVVAAQEVVAVGASLGAIVADAEGVGRPRHGILDTQHERHAFALLIGGVLRVQVTEPPAGERIGPLGQGVVRGRAGA